MFPLFVTLTLFFSIAGESNQTIGFQPENDLANDIHFNYELSQDDLEDKIDGLDITERQTGLIFVSWCSDTYGVAQSSTAVFKQDQYSNRNQRAPPYSLYL